MTDTNNYDEWFFCKRCETSQTKDAHGNLFKCCIQPKMVRYND